MTRQHVLGSVEAVKALAEKLRQCPAVTRLDIPQQGPESWALAHALSEFERSFDRIAGQLLPQLVQETGPDAIVDCLHAIGEELRHISWHINDSNYYSYLRVDDSKA